MAKGSPTSFAGLTLDIPLIMGVVNVTPDSFSDGGETYDTKTAIEHGQILIESGAQILDIGGESTRPGADTVSPEQEIDRVLPVIEGLAESGAVISVDTRKSQVMEAALKSGATIINDITALNGDPLSLDVAAKHKAWVILMHMQGSPTDMQDDPTYRDAPRDIIEYLSRRIAACQKAGIERSRIAVDPGIGFGKTVRHNVSILSRLNEFQKLNCTLVLGVSRKSFIGHLSKGESPKDRLPGSLAAALAGVTRGAHILRVHDVPQTRQALDIWNAIEKSLIIYRSS